MKGIVGTLRHNTTNGLLLLKNYDGGGEREGGRGKFEQSDELESRPCVRVRVVREKKKSDDRCVKFSLVAVQTTLLLGRCLFFRRMIYSAVLSQAPVSTAALHKLHKSLTKSAENLRAEGKARGREGGREEKGRGRGREGGGREEWRRR